MEYQTPMSGTVVQPAQQPPMLLPAIFDLRIVNERTGEVLLEQFRILPSGVKIKTQGLLCGRSMNEHEAVSALRDLMLECFVLVHDAFTVRRTKHDIGDDPAKDGGMCVWDTYTITLRKDIDPKKLAGEHALRDGTLVTFKWVVSMNQ